MSSPTEKVYLRIAEAARMLDVSERTIRRRIRDGTLPIVRLGRLVRIPSSALAPSIGPPNRS
jgi:excisionase family DNA binding protein